MAPHSILLLPQPLNTLPLLPLLLMGLYIIVNIEIILDSIRLGIKQYIINAADNVLVIEEQLQQEIIVYLLELCQVHGSVLFEVVQS